MLAAEKYSYLTEPKEGEEGVSEAKLVCLRGVTRGGLDSKNQPERS